MAIYTKPKPHQIEGAKFLAPKRVGIIGAKTGKGKTLIVIACIHKYVKNAADFAVVFAPPKAYDKVWGQEVKKHSDMKVIKLETVADIYKDHGSSHEYIIDYLKKFDIVLAKYSQVNVKFYPLLHAIMPKRIIVFDEAHKLKSPSTKLVRLMSNLTTNARAKWAITATAIGNSIFDLWGLMHFLDSAVLGTEWQFKKAYCELEDKVIGWEKKFGRMMQKTVKEVVGYKNLDNLKIIMSNYLWTVESDLSVTFHTIEYSMTDFEDKVYIKAAKGVLDRIVDEKKGFAQRMPDLQRVVDGALDIDGKPTQGFRSSKYVKFQSKIAELLSKGQSIILFAEFIATYEMLNRLIKEDFPNVPIYRISGSDLEYDENNVKTPCIILATMSGTESLNLKFANHVMTYSVPFNVLGFIQLVGRITRMDSEFLDDLNVYIPKCETNIDKYKFTYLEQNAALVNELLGKDANLPEKSLADMRKGLLEQMRRDLLWRIRKK